MENINYLPIQREKTDSGAVGVKSDDGLAFVRRVQRAFLRFDQVRVVGVEICSYGKGTISADDVTAGKLVLGDVHEAQ